MSHPQPNRRSAAIRSLGALALLAASSTWLRADAEERRPTPSGDGDNAFPFPVVEKVLPNGLRVFVIRFDSPGLCAFYSVVRVGSRNEVEPGKSGFAHFFEHMMFRGTERYPAERYNATLKAMGADSNAWTSDDLTVYHILARKTALPTIVEIEADRFMNLSYQEPEFQKEARAVLGEYNKSASNPLQKMFEALSGNAFELHTYKHTTIGFLEDIEAMPQQFTYSRQFFDRYYRPDMVSLVVVGDVVPEDVFRLVERHYGAWKQGPARPTIPVEPPQRAEKRVALDWKGATLPVLLMGFHGPAFSTTVNDGVALDVLAEVLFAKRAPLYKKLVIDEQKVEDLSGGNESRVDPGLFTVLARVKKAADLPAVEAAVTAEIDRVGRMGVDAGTLKTVLSHERYDFARNLSTADEVATVAAEFIALSGNLSAINSRFRLLAKVTSADVQRVARKYLAPTNRTVVTLTAKTP
jgi:zinc protease